MDITNKLILIDGEDKTDSVETVSFEEDKCRITYHHYKKEYSYHPDKVQILQQQGSIAPKTVVVTAENRVISGITDIRDYGAYCQIVTDKGSRVYKKTDLTMEENTLSHKKPAERLAYFASIASAVSLKSGEDFNILEHQYQKITEVRSDTVLGSYLEGVTRPETRRIPETLLYPFGMNQSQKQAVEHAFSSQVSIIQGPPGTGKTQTILNILANAVVLGKTVAVVSGNNSATANVAEKLEKQKLDFLTTFLGSRANKEAFLGQQTGKYPSMRGWKLPEEERESRKERVRLLSEEINRRLSDRNRIAAIRQELLDLEPERRSFEAYYETCPAVSRREKLFLSSEKAMQFLNEYTAAVRNQEQLGFFRRLMLFLRYNRQVLRLLREKPEAVVPYVQSEFYRIRLAELDQEQKLLESNLRNYCFEERLQELTEDSMALLRDNLVRRYHYTKPRRIFEPGELALRSEEFLEEYPVVLSTTYSIKSCLHKQTLYDYVIVDEASQVDLATGVLALSCARNVIIVGDRKQLPNVLTAEDVRLADGFWDPRLGNGYCFTRHSLLSSAAAVWKEAPAVLLREHYRCHPRIIHFCNQEFYDGKLILLTEDHGESDVLSLVHTVEGNHARGRINQREADVIKKEVLPQLRKKGFRDIGVITPYRDQVELLQKELPEKIEIDTVHRFQGREKDAVILTSVDNVIGSFVDDPHMLNVAVSRAVRSLTVVTSSNPRNDRTLYGDLARYITYHNQQIRSSTTYSVFDLLYREYARQRREYLRKHRRVSEYDSENLLAAVLEQVLQVPEFRNLDFACHVALGGVIRDRALLSDEERQYLTSPLTHLDFLVFHRMDKMPLLAIEVDGVRFHQKGSAQEKRDRKKDHILEVTGLPLLRLRTDSSGEREKLEQALHEALQRS